MSINFYTLNQALRENWFAQGLFGSAQANISIGHSYNEAYHYLSPAYLKQIYAKEEI